MTLPSGLEITPMGEDDLARLHTWAAEEGWNPGLSDIRIAWTIDPEAFVALRRRGEMIGGGSIFSYEGKYGFMGLFIMRPDVRKQGLGSLLWTWRRDRLLARLDGGASIGMDGVFEMAPFYERGASSPRIAMCATRASRTASMIPASPWAISRTSRISNVMIDRFFPRNAHAFFVCGCRSLV